MNDVMYNFLLASVHTINGYTFQSEFKSRPRLQLEREESVNAKKISVSGTLHHELSS